MWTWPRPLPGLRARPACRRRTWPASAPSPKSRRRARARCGSGSRCRPRDRRRAAGGAGWGGGSVSWRGSLGRGDAGHCPIRARAAVAFAADSRFFYGVRPKHGPLPVLQASSTIARCRSRGEPPHERTQQPEAGRRPSPGLRTLARASSRAQAAVPDQLGHRARAALRRGGGRRTAGPVPLHARHPPEHVPRPALDHAPVRGLLERARDQPALPASCSRAGRPASPSAFDLPTQIGYDSDHALARDEVGLVGVPVNSLRDLERLFEEIPLGEVSTSMTINATAPMLLALYCALATKQGVALEALRGTVQNDILKEYAARGNYRFPAGPSMRLVTDLMALRGRARAAVEHDLDLGLPHPRGGLDRGAGAGLHARQRPRLRAGGARGRPRARRSSRRGSRSSSTRTTTSSRRWPSSAPRAACGRASCARSSARRTRRAGCCASTRRPPARC